MSAPNKKRVINHDDLGISIPPTKLVEDDVHDIGFFNSDIDEYNEQLVKAEHLYSEMHGLYEGLTGGDYLPTKSIRDIAEIGKTLVSARSLCSDIAHKRHQAKKNVSDIVAKRKGDDGEAGGEIRETARQLVSVIHQEMAGMMKQKVPVSKAKREILDAKRDTEIRELDGQIDKLISSGAIKLNAYDKLLDYDGHIRVEYDMGAKKFVAVDDRDGAVIPGYPKHDLPDVKIARSSKTDVFTSTGETYPIRGSIEYGEDGEDDE